MNGVEGSPGRYRGVGWGKEEGMRWMSAVLWKRKRKEKKEKI